MTHRVLRTALVGLVVVSIFLLGACEQGPGSRGPAGPQGPPGPAGPPGAGELTARTFTVRASGFTLTELSPGSGSAAISFRIPELTASVVSKGSVVAYVAAPSAPNEWVALPWSIAIRAEVVTVWYAYAPGGVTLWVSANVPATVLSRALPVFDGYRFRVAIAAP